MFLTHPTLVLCMKCEKWKSIFSLTLWQLFYLELHISFSQDGHWANSCWWFCPEKWPNMCGHRGRSPCFGVETFQTHKPRHRGWTVCPAASVNTYKLGRYGHDGSDWRGHGVDWNTSRNVSGCWANLYPRQLDELAKNSTSKSTQNQTKWAVQIFRGKFVTDFPAVFDSCQTLFLFCNLADPGTWLATALLIGGKPGQQIAAHSKTPTIEDLLFNQNDNQKLICFCCTEEQCFQ